ncbi:hypothetical protein COOONC_07313 [Cooperia oncophora]
MKPFFFPSCRLSIASLLTQEQFRLVSVVIFCVPEISMRDFMLHLMDGGYLNPEYVFISVNVKSKGFTVPQLGGKQRYMWVDADAHNDGRDEEAREAFQYLLVLTDHMSTGGNATKYARFSDELVSRMKDPPFHCANECNGSEFRAVSFLTHKLFILLRNILQFNKLCSSADYVIVPQSSREGVFPRRHI